MVVDKARELNKNPHSNISLDLHPQIEKAPEGPQSPRVQHVPVASHQSPLDAPEPGKGFRLQPSLLTAQPEYFIFISLPSFAVAVVNLPFSKFNKTLIEKKKKEEKSHFKPTIKGQLTSQFSSGQEKKSGIRREKLNSAKLSP